MDVSASDVMPPGAPDAPEGSQEAGRQAAPRFAIEVDTLAPETWDRLVGDFDDLTLDQTACYSDGLWGPGRTSHLLLRRNGVPVAGARLAILTLPCLRRGLAFTRFGPFWRRSGAPDVEIYRSVVSALIEEYCVRRGHCLTVIPRANPEHYRTECAILAEFGFEMRRPFQDTNRYLVDLALDEAAQMRSFEQKWRYNLRQALRAGLDIRLCEGERDLATFTALHGAMVRRKRFRNGDPLHLLPDLSLRLPARMRPRVVLAFHDGRPVFGAVIALLGDTAYYVFGASDDSALPLKAGYALHWWIVRWLSGQGVRWYDLGGEALEPGLRQFKKGFVGKHGAVVVMQGEFDRWTGTPGRMIADTIYRLRDAKRAIASLRYPN